MKPLLLLATAISLVSCGKDDRALTNQQVSKSGLEEMLVVAGQEYITTVGAEQAEGPYEYCGSFTGSSGSGTTFGTVKYEFPKDGRSYIARRFRNPDGTEFMKISRYPEGVGEVD